MPRLVGRPKKDRTNACSGAVTSGPVRLQVNSPPADAGRWTPKQHDENGIIGHRDHTRPGRYIGALGRRDPLCWSTDFCARRVLVHRFYVLHLGGLSRQENHPIGWQRISGPAHPLHAAVNQPAARNRMLPARGGVTHRLKIADSLRDVGCIDFGRFRWVPTRSGQTDRCRNCISSNLRFPGHLT